MSIKKLTPSSFNSSGGLVSNSPTFAMFYVGWCGHCNNLKPVWNELAKMSGFCTIAAYDCEAYPDHFKMYNNNKLVEGYPTLLFFKDGKTPIKYNGSRELKSLVQFAMNMCDGKGAQQPHPSGGPPKGGAQVPHPSGGLPLGGAPIGDNKEPFGFVKPNKMSTRGGKCSRGGVCRR